MAAADLTAPSSRGRVHPRLYRALGVRGRKAAIAASRFTVLHHSRLMWKNPGHYSEEAWRSENKHNDWLLDGFAALIRERPQLDPLLVILEFGPDVEATRERIAELGVPTYELPRLSDGVDLGGLYELAADLCEQGLA